MNSTVRRILAIVVILGGSIAIARYMKSQKEPPQKNTEKVIQNVVEVMVFEPGVHQVRIPVSGRIRAKDKIIIIPEVTGKLLSGSRPFKEGIEFLKGQVLMRLDDSDARMGVIAQRSAFQSALTLLLADIKIDHKDEFSNWYNYLADFDQNSELDDLPVPEDQQLKNFLVGKGVYRMFYEIKAAEARLRKYMVAAPFNGVLESANVTEGEVIRAGQPIGTFLRTDRYELEVGVNVLDKEKISVGNEVTLTSTDTKGSWSGKVARMSEAIHASTQTFKIYLDVLGSGLYDGMYLSGWLVAGSETDVMPYPANLISAENEVFVVEGSTLRAKSIEVVHKEGNRSLIKGIPQGTTLITSVVPGIRDGLVIDLKTNESR